MRSKLIGAVMAALVLAGGVAAAIPSAAAAHSRTFIACDDIHNVDYAQLKQAPRSCDLGLGLSGYQSQPSSCGPCRSTATRTGWPFTDVRLRGLRWRGWGRYSAVGYGSACSVGARFCGPVTITVFNPEAIMPAGGAVIYQLIWVSLGRSRWYFQPGTDH